MLVIAETSTSTWNYHLREIGSEEELKLGGGAGPALCGAPLGWDTKIPLTAWGKKSHIPEKWCKECEKLARPLVERENALVAWFKELYASRTPSKSVLDAHPQYKVIWTEIRMKMMELGYKEHAVDQRYEWDRIFKLHKLKKHCNHLLKEAGEQPIS